jgi:hypothetical protein
MIAEVNNTFDERRMYLLPAAAADIRPGHTAAPPTDPGPARKQKFHHAWSKDFHVSPFSSRKGSYALSAIDPCLSDGSHGADAVDVTATLLSSKGRPKLVARLCSNETPLDPATVPKYQALVFLLSWSLVGLMTCAYYFLAACFRTSKLARWGTLHFTTDPRIVFEALMLGKRRHLDVYYRPEPGIETVPRRSTAAER